MMAWSLRKWGAFIRRVFHRQKADGPVAKRMSQIRPRRCHKFRVRAVSASGDVSDAGDACVVNTLLETPQPPKLALTAPFRAVSGRRGSLRKSQVGLSGDGTHDGVGGGLDAKYAVHSTRVKLAWPLNAAFARGAGAKAATSCAAARILQEWTGVAADDDGAVCLEVVLGRFSSGQQAGKSPFWKCGRGAKPPVFRLAAVQNVPDGQNGALERRSVDEDAQAHVSQRPATLASTSRPNGFFNAPFLKFQ